MTTPKVARPWDAFTYRIDLTDAQIIATLGYDGGAITETVAKLECLEGRTQTFETKEGGEELHQLEYFFSFGVADTEDPLGAEQSQARVVIIGTDDRDKRIEIRGNGWIGYDNDGNVEGRFDTPPAIITEDPDDDEEEEDSTEPRPTLSNILDFPMPANYRAATVRVDGPPEDWESD